MPPKISHSKKQKVAESSGNGGIPAEWADHGAAAIEGSSFLEWVYLFGT